jgi:hypothetical protein
MTGMINPTPTVSIMTVIRTKITGNGIRSQRPYGGGEVAGLIRGNAHLPPHVKKIRWQIWMGCAT